MDLIKLPQFPSVAAGAISTLVTDKMLDRTVFGLAFERGGTTFANAQIDNIRVRLGGKDIVNGITGTQLAALNDYVGVVDVANYTFLFFGDPTARTIRGEYFGALDCSIYRQPMEIEVSIDAGAAAPTLQAYALTHVPKMALGLGYSQVDASYFRALIRSIVQPAGAVSRKAYGISLGSSPGGRIRRLAFYHANLTSVELKKASIIKYDDVSDALNSAVQQQFARTPQAGLYVLDRIVDANEGEAEMTVDSRGQPWSLELDLTTSAADTIYAFADMHLTMPML